MCSSILHAIWQKPHKHPSSDCAHNNMLIASRSSTLTCAPLNHISAIGHEVVVRRTVVCTAQQGKCERGAKKSLSCAAACCVVEATCSITLPSAYAVIQMQRVFGRALVFTVTSTKAFGKMQIFIISDKRRYIPYSCKKKHIRPNINQNQIALKRFHQQTIHEKIKTKQNHRKLHCNINI